jgi:uncharacterized membrane protein YgdD (TMEM256/DUF423 family)
MKDPFDRFSLAAGALLAASGIMLGAFAAHALKARLGAAELGWWQTAVQYQMWNALGLVALAAVPGVRRAAMLVLAGAILFSGSLYLMALTGARILGAVTPVGGALMILGWLLVAWKQSGRVER